VPGCKSYPNDDHIRLAHNRCACGWAGVSHNQHVAQLDVFLTRQAHANGMRGPGRDAVRAVHRIVAHQRVRSDVLRELLRRAA
jgi:hypothetical protein